VQSPCVGVQMSEIYVTVTFLGYRWGVAGPSTPWFPSARVFHQSTPDAWGPVIERVRDALVAFVGRGA
jgi:hypothetical protein